MSRPPTDPKRAARGSGPDGDPSDIPSACPQGAATPPAEVAEELRLLDTVLTNLRRLASGPAEANHERRLVELRDALEGEKLVDDIASIMEEMDRTAALMAQQARGTDGRVDLASPYFGRMLLDDELGRRSILVGKSTFLSDRVRIVDWRNAPVSRIFYQYAEGDEYEEEIAGRMLTGEVLAKRSVTIIDGELTRVATEDATWVKTAAGPWLDLRTREAKLAGGAGAAIRPQSLGTAGTSGGRSDKHLPEIASLLDAEQFALITRPQAGVVVIQGSAGSGKTTVGLHRIAYLHFHQPGRFRPQRMLVLVFSKALSAYISQVLPALGVEGVAVQQYQRWAEALRKRHFRGIPEAYSDETPALVVRFKTHSALLPMLEQLARDRAGDDVVTVFEEAFTDKGWIERGLRTHAPGAFSDAEIAKIHRWCVTQHIVRADGGAGDHEKPCFDREDDTILLRLWQLMRGPLRAKKKAPLLYDHVLVDEAQDLSPPELAVVLGTAGKRQSVTLAGDTAQRIEDLRDFASWTHVLKALRLDHLEISPLQVSYRSTRQIMTVAREILGPLAPDEPITAPREGAPVAHLRFHGMGEAVAWLAPALTDLLAREPTAYVALLTRDLDDAVRWYGAFDRAEVPSLGLVDDQSFSFRPGIEVADIRSSKGLEFDYVVLLGVDAGPWTVSDHHRHLLHVGATRGAHQLWIVSTGTPAAIVPEGLPGLDG